MDFNLDLLVYLVFVYLGTFFLSEEFIDTAGLHCRGSRILKVFVVAIQV